MGVWRRRRWMLVTAVAAISAISASIPPVTRATICVRVRGGRGRAQRQGPLRPVFQSRHVRQDGRRDAGRASCLPAERWLRVHVLVQQRLGRGARLHHRWRGAGERVQSERAVPRSRRHVELLRQRQVGFWRRRRCLPGTAFVASIAAIGRASAASVASAMDLRPRWHGNTDRLWHRCGVWRRQLRR